MDVDPIFVLAMPQARESCDADEVAMFATDGGAHHGDLFALSRVVTELVEYFRNHDGLSCAGIEYESKWSPCSSPIPNHSFNEDQLILGIEPRDLHGMMNRGIGPRILPVQNDPTSLYRSNACLM